MSFRDTEPEALVFKLGAGSVMRPVHRCPRCGAKFDPATSYAGHHGSRRAYCSEDCRRLARNERARDKRVHARRYAGLIAMHQQEEAGQLSLVADPLPPVPSLTAGGH